MADFENWDSLRDKIIGLGENSARKSYYPELQNRIADLQRFRSLLDQTADGIFQIEAETGNIIELNLAAANLLNLTTSELTGKSIFPFFSADVKDTINNTFSGISPENSAVLTINTTLVSKSNEKMDIELSVQMVSLNEQKFFVIITRDITEQKKAQDQLKANASWLSVLFERSPMAVIITDENRIILQINQAFCEMSGYSKEELKGKYAGMVHVSEKSAIDFATNHYDNILKGEQERCEYQLKRKNGELYWVESIGQAFDPADLSKGTIWQIMEITDKRNSAIALKESEEKFRTITEQMADVVFIVDKEGVCRYISPASWYIFNLNPRLILNKQFFDLLIPDDINAINNAFRKVINENVPLKDYRVTLLNKDGHKFIGEINATKYTGHGYEGLLGVLHDVTERTETELHVQKLTKGIEQSSAIIVITDSEGIIEYVNPKFESVSGYSFMEAVGQNPRILKSSQTDPAIYKQMWETIKTGKEWKGEILNCKKNGDLFWENVQISPIFNEKFEIINFIGIKEDITEKKQMIQELIEAKESAEEMNRLKTSFLANMSHELRTPMLGILGYSGIMKDIAPDDELKMMAETIHASGTRLIETLNLILDISRIEAGKLELNISSMDIPLIIKECIKTYEKTAQANNLYIRFDSYSDSLLTKGDKRLFRDIINNLLNNAIKFTNSGGVSVNVKLLAPENLISIEVIDTGIGIPAEQHEIIFEEFRQVSEGLNRTFEGTGLGLTLTKKFVDKLGGTISLKSTPGSGSTFTVLLPYIPAEEILSIDPVKVSQDNTPAETFTTGKNEVPKMLNILLVENDLTNQMVITEYLKKQHTLFIALNGEAALKAVEEKQYDIVLMDINLGRGLSGIEVTQKLRSLPLYKDVPIVAITAFAMKGDKEEFLSQGCTAYLSKPFSKMDLLNIIDEIKIIN